MRLCMVLFLIMSLMRVVIVVVALHRHLIRTLVVLGVVVALTLMGMVGIVLGSNWVVNLSN